MIEATVGQREAEGAGVEVAEEQEKWRLRRRYWTAEVCSRAEEGEELLDFCNPSL